MGVEPGADDDIAKGDVKFDRVVLIGVAGVDYRRKYLVNNTQCQRSDDNTIWSDVTFFKSKYVAVRLLYSWFYMIALISYRDGKVNRQTSIALMISARLNPIRSIVSSRCWSSAYGVEHE